MVNPLCPIHEVGMDESKEEPSVTITVIAAAAAPQLKERTWPSNAGLGSLMVHVPEMEPVVY